MTIQDVAEHEINLLPTTTAKDSDASGMGSGVTLTDAMVRGRGLLPTPSVADGTGGHARRGGDRGDELLLPGVAVDVASKTTTLPTPRASRGASTTETAYALGGERTDDDRPQGEVILGEIDWGPYEAAIRRWEGVLGRPAPPPVRHDGRNGKARLNPELTEWMMGWPAGWVTDPALGLSREQQLKACGNGVVPQQAEAALREMLAREGVPPLEPLSEAEEAAVRADLARTREDVWENG